MKIIERSEIDSELLRTFLAIAETGNLTQAAALLSRTQSAISVQIRKLEDAMRTSLFHRQPRGMLLTENGHKLLPQARHLVQEVDRISQLFCDSLSGQLSIGIPDDFPRPLLETILRDFTRLYPQVEITVRSSYSETFQQAINKAELDLALFTTDTQQHSEDTVYQEPLVWAAHKDFVIAKDRPVPVALFNRECWWRDVAINALQTSGIDYRVAFSSESMSGIVAAINTGLAVAMLAESSLSADMRRISAPQLPSLPDSATLLLQADTNPLLTDAMAGVIRQVCAVRSPSRPSMSES